jgi:signal transduction histidine kinase
MSFSTQHLIALFTVFITTFSLGIFVFIKNRRGRITRVFVLYSQTLAIWGLGQGLHSIAPDKTTALFWGRFGHLGIIFIPSTLLHFIFNFLEIKGPKRRIINIAYGISFFFLLTNFIDGLFIADVVPKLFLKYFIEPGFFYLPYVIFFVICAVYALHRLFKAYISSSGAKRNQLKYLYWGLLISYIGGSPNFLFVFDIKVPILNPYGTYAVPLYTLIMVYAIIKYRLMDIDIVIGKLATYSFLLAIISGIYLGLVWGVGKVFSQVPGYYPLVSDFSIFILLSIAFIYFIPRIKGKTEEKIGKVFFKNKFKYREILREFNKRLILIPAEEQLLTEAVNNITAAMEVNKVAIILMDELSENYIVRASLGLDEKAKKLVLTPQHGIIKWLAENKKVFLAEEIDKILTLEEFEKIKIELKDMQAPIYLPLIIHNQLGGVLVLGEKLSRQMFSHIDIELLEDFANQLALSISYKRLESRMMRADRLVSLGTLAASMAHEIRNPLSSIQIFAQLLPEKYDDKEFREEFSKIVASDTLRINRIIESVLALANPKPSIPTTCNVNALLDETLFLIENKIKKEGVAVIKNYDKHLPQIKADKEQIQQALLNILLNALAALSKDEGRLTISTRQKLIPSVTSGQEEKYIQIEIKDNGVGIEKKLLERIFEPFFTTRPDGTGLGLAIVHRIIEQHKGSIKVDSEVGKGTLFLINLPLGEKND